MGHKFYGTLSSFELVYGISAWWLRQLVKRYDIKPYMKGGIYRAAEIEKCIRRYNFDRDIENARMAREFRSLSLRIEILAEYMGRIGERLGLPGIEAIKNKAIENKKD